MKKLALFLVAVLMFTGMTPALAADDMTQIVLAVKNRVPVPEECSEFNGSPYTNNGKKEWHFSWSTEGTDEDYMYISAEINEDNIITNYYLSDRNRRYGKMLPKITKEEALSAATDFFAKSNPDIAAVYDFADAQINYSDNTYFVRADRKENKLYVYGDYAQLEISGESLRVNSMSVRYTPYLVFEDYDAAITTEQAEEAFEQLGGLKLLYKSYYTGEDEEKTAHPVYISSGKGILIDALTGAEAVREEGASVYTSNSKAEFGRVEMTAADKASGGAQLTQQEIGEIEKLTELITPQQAEETLRSMSELNFAADAVMTYSGIYKQGDEDYIMDIGFESENHYCNAQIDAQTGELMSFYGYVSTAGDDATVYTAEQGKEAAEAFASKYFDGYVNSAVKNENTLYKENDKSYRASWTRVENGLEYSQNSMNVTVDLNSLKVTSFGLNWDKDRIFEGVDDIIDASVAYDKLFGYIAPQLVYYINGNKTAAAPVYVTELDGFEAINAKSGKAVDYSGYEYVTQSEQEYIDIDGHYAQEEIRALAGIGVRFDGNEFKPDSIITQGEYLELVSNCVMNYYPIVGGRADESKIYSNAVSYGIINKEDVSPEQPLTRELAVTYLLRAMDYTEFAEIDGIFRCDFTDIADISQNLFGYVAIAKGLKIISGTEGNMFLPQKQMTRAEASIIIYNYLSR